MTQPNQSKLPLREMLAFGCGDFASVLYWQTFMKYLPFFYTDVFGITAGALATMLLVSRIWDGVNDPIIGMWADRTKSRWGRFRPFILMGCVPFAVLGVLTFTTPGFDQGGKLIWAYLTYNGLMMMYTFINIPYTALMGVMTNDGAERTRLSSIKFLFAFTAGMVVSASLLPLVNTLGGTDNPQRGWSLAFVVVGITAIAFFLVTFFGTKERISPPDDPEASVGKDIKYLLTNKAWLILLATTLTWVLFVALRSSVSTHYFKYFVYGGNETKELSVWGFSFTMTGLVSAFNTLGQAASVAGVLLITFIADKFPKRGLFITLFGSSIVCYAAFFFLTPQDLPTMFVIEVISSAFGAPLPVLLWAMYADTADYGEWKTGRRTTGLVFSASTMGQKFGWAISAFLAFQLLQAVGFVANEAPSESVKNSLVSLVSLYPAALGVLSIVIFLFYPLNEKRVAEINADLKARRSAA